MKLPMQTIFVITSAHSWLYRCPWGTSLQLYICKLQQSISSLSKDKPKSPILLQPCWPPGNQLRACATIGSRGLWGELIPALSQSSYRCSCYRDPAASSWDSISRQVSNQPGLLGRAQFLLFAQSPAKSGIEIAGPVSHHCCSAVGRWLTSCSSLLRTSVLRGCHQKGLCAACSATELFPLCFLQLLSDEVVVSVYKQQVKLFLTLGS